VMAVKFVNGIDLIRDSLINARVEMVATGLAFSTTLNGTLAEHMRLTGAGLLGLEVTAPSYGLHQLGGAAYEQAFNLPWSLSIRNQGAAGSTQYAYRIYAVDRAGRRTLATMITTPTGNATLSGSNFNRISWAAVTNAVSYYVTRNSTTAHIGNPTATTLDDTGQATSAFTAPTHNETGDLFAGGSLGLNTTAPTYGLQQLGGGFCQQMLGTPTNFTVTNGGTSGSTTYNYWLYAVDRAGRRTLAATATIANANATLSAVNFNSLSWTAVTGAAYYLIAKGSATNI